MATKQLPPSDDRPTPAEDLRLVREALNGRAGAVEGLGKRLECVPRILSIINARRGSPLSDHDLEDLVQDVVVRIWQKLETFRGHVTLEFWCHRFCHLETMNRLRQKSRASVVSSSHPVAVEAAEPAQDEGVDGKLVRMEEALDALDPALAEIVRMRTFERLDFDQMGLRLGVPPATAKSRYYRALGELRDRMKRMEGRP